MVENGDNVMLHGEDDEDDDDSYKNFVKKQKEKHEKKKGRQILMKRKRERREAPLAPIRPPPERILERHVSLDDSNDITLNDDDEIAEPTLEEREQAILDELRREMEMERSLQRSQPATYHANGIQSYLGTLNDIRRVSVEPQVAEDTPDADEESKNADPIFYLQVSDLENKGECTKHQMKSSSTFEHIRETIAKKWNCPAQQVILRHEQDTISENDSPASLRMNKLLVAKLIAFKTAVASSSSGQTVPSKPERPENTVHLKFQMSGIRRPLKIYIEKTATIKKVAELVSIQLGRNVKKMVFDHEDLDVDVTVEEMDLEDDDCIDVYV